RRSWRSPSVRSPTSTPGARTCSARRPCSTRRPPGPEGAPDEAMTVASPAALLAAAGVEEPERLAQRFSGLWDDVGAPAELAAAWLECADPALAVASLERLREAQPDETAAVLADPELARNLV